MSSPTSSRWSRPVGAEYDLDCPNPSCNGWMFFLRIKEKTFLSFSDVRILIKMQLGLAKFSASLQPKRELVRPVQNI